MKFTFFYDFQKSLFAKIAFHHSFTHPSFTILINITIITFFTICFTILTTKNYDNPYKYIYWCILNLEQSNRNISSYSEIFDKNILYTSDNYGLIIFVIRYAHDFSINYTDIKGCNIILLLNIHNIISSIVSFCMNIHC